MVAETGPNGVRRAIGVGLAILGAAVLAGSLLLIMQRLGTLAIWNVAAHEDGVRTFGDTVLYFEHAVRELPLDILLGVATGGGLAYALPLRPQAKAPIGLLLALAGVLGVMFAGAIGDVGVKAFFDNLLQNHTRPGAPLEWGAHWRYHLLASLSLILLTFGGAGLLRALAGAGTRAQAARGAVVVAGVLAVFAAGTLLFAHSIAGMVEPFADPIFIGHEARELFTHVLVTLPIAWGAGILMARDVEGPATVADRRQGAPRWIGAIALGVVLGLYLCGLAVTLDSASSGQTDDVVMLIAPHFYEHAQTYLVVTLVALITQRLAAGRGR